MKNIVDLFFVWFKLGLFTFGGGYAMLPMIQREIIEKRGWASEEEVLDYYAIGQCTPGVIAVNTATFIGYKVAGYLGGIIATLAIVLPSLLIISLISNFISNFSQLDLVQHILAGIRVSVSCLLIMAISKLFKSNIKGYASFSLMVACFVLAYFLNVSTVFVVVFAALMGLVLTRFNLLKEEER